MRYLRHDILIMGALRIWQVLRKYIAETATQAIVPSRDLN